MKILSPLIETQVITEGHNTKNIILNTNQSPLKCKKEYK